MSAQFIFCFAFFRRFLLRCHSSLLWPDSNSKCRAINLFATIMFVKTIWMLFAMAFEGVRFNSPISEFGQIEWNKVIIYAFLASVDGQLSIHTMHAPNPKWYPFPRNIDFWICCVVGELKACHSADRDRPKQWENFQVWIPDVTFVDSAESENSKNSNQLSANKSSAPMKLDARKNKSISRNLNIRKDHVNNFGSTINNILTLN